LVVVERGSRKITYWDTSVAGIPNHVVLDLAPLAHMPGGFSDFAGVTAFAFHPDFLTDPAKRFFYVRYNSPNPAPTTHIDRWEIPPGSLKAYPNTRTAIYTFPTASTSHPSGTIHFDTAPSASSKLYVPMPDNSGVSIPVSAMDCCDQSRVQGTMGPTDLGQLMAIDVDATPPVAWSNAVGLRNPFGFSVDAGDVATGFGQGDVWIGDVGHTFTGNIIRWVPGGAYRNYGWPWSEGNGNALWPMQPQIQQTPCGASPSNVPVTCGEPVPTTYSLPYTVFSDFQEFPNGGRDALIGGYVYRRSIVPALTNEYVFATYGAGVQPRVYRLPAAGGGGVTPTNMSATLGLMSWSTDHTIHALGQDIKGEIYIVRVDESGGLTGNGDIFRITP